MTKTSESRYQVPALLPRIYCAACLKVVLKKDKQAKNLWGYIVKTWAHPALSQPLGDIQDSMPSGDVALGIFQEEVAKHIEEAKKNSQAWIPDESFFDHLYSKATTHGSTAEKLPPAIQMVESSREFRHIEKLIPSPAGNSFDPSSRSLRAPADG